METYHNDHYRATQPTYSIRSVQEQINDLRLKVEQLEVLINEKDQMIRLLNDELTYHINIKESF
jgi:hypothetical protein